MDLSLNYKASCRICLKVSEEMTSLYGLQIPQSTKYVVDFLRKITDLKLTRSEHLPHNICPVCLNDILTANRLVDLCITSDNVLRNQETRRILRKIEAEALGDDFFVKCENRDQVDSDSGILLESDSETDTSTDAKTTKTHQFITVKANNKYICEACSLSFSNKRKFIKHQTVHNKKPFECRECKQTFLRKLNLDIHLHSHTKDKKYSCNRCGQQFIFQYQLKQHEYKHSDKKPFPCAHCKKGCLTAESLKRHMKIHEDGYTKKSYCCDICSKTFPYPSFLAEHMKNHTGEKPHLCSICGKGFRQSGALHFHQRIHSGSKPFKCNICQENFISQSVLKIHIRKHTNERPYICDTCGTSFRQCQDLKRHRLTHTGEKPILCNICGKKMCTSGQLTIHLRSHTGERPFRCTECDRAFTTRTALVKHTTSHKRRTSNNVNGTQNKLKKEKECEEEPIESGTLPVISSGKNCTEHNVAENVSEIDDEPNIQSRYAVILPTPISLIQYK